ncbi:hypothetical protein SLEP1_g12930 [Rubroshorea leprosula]|uniref:Uncharacterized protein n=1 Tax=Rubroshorea leprosula TaxID=152421 RepID=A0AAV5IE49_9ROSI|nr:hypothetical protein SLEP1_g12930 [Rubroshorea leprosula]
MGQFLAMFLWWFNEYASVVVFCSLCAWDCRSCSTSLSRLNP